MGLMSAQKPRGVPFGRRQRHPSNTPIDEWPIGWLKMAVASGLNNPSYLTMSDGVKLAAGLPVTEDEMRALIRAKKWNG